MTIESLSIVNRQSSIYNRQLICQPGGGRRALDWNGRRQRRAIDDRRLDESPGMPLLENFCRKLRVERVTGAVRHQMAHDRIADQRRIAHGAEDLVPDELILEP